MAVSAALSSPDLRTFQRDLRRTSPALARAFNAELGLIGRSVRDDARGKLYETFVRDTGKAGQAIKSSVARGRLTVYIDARTATDAKGRPYPVFLHQGWAAGGSGFVPGRPVLDEAFAAKQAHVDEQLGTVLDRTLDRYLIKKGT
jgi:hypothetical protein